MKVDLYYVADIYCLWCYGFSRTIDRIATEYADRVELRLINGCMIPQEMPLGEFFGRFPDPIGLHQRVTEMSGQAFGEPYLEHIRNHATSKRKLNSLVPARAMAATHMLSVTDSLAVSSEMQRAHYDDGLDLFLPESYRALNCMKTIDFEQFKTLLVDKTTLSTALKGVRWLNDVGVKGFPALLLKQSETRYKMIARGFTPYEGVKAGLDAALGSLLDVATTTGVACQTDGTGCQ
jgi:putative protein-disulfide isomerase